MIRLFLFSLLCFTSATNETQAFFNSKKNNNYEYKVLKAYKKHWYKSKKRQEIDIAKQHVKFYDYTQNINNYNIINEFGFEYLHRLGMNGNGIDIAVIENDFMEAEGIKFKEDTIIQSPALTSTYNNKKNLIEQLIELSDESEKIEAQEKLNTLNKQYYECIAHSLHVVGIINKIAPGITIYPIHALDFNDPETLKSKLDNFAGSVITHSTAVGLSDEAQTVLKPILNNHAYFRAASNEGCFLSEPHLQHIKELPALHVSLPDVILVGNYDQEQKIIHETSNLPGKDYAANFIFAEGTNIESLSVNEHCEIIKDKKTGTSFAAPYVATVCAMLAKYYPDLSIKVIQKKLLESADKFSKNHNSLLFGQGLINTRKTLRNLQKDADSLSNDDEIMKFAQTYFPTIPDHKLKRIISRYNKKKLKKPIRKRIYLINKFNRFIINE